MLNRKKIFPVTNLFRRWKKSGIVRPTFSAEPYQQKKMKYIQTKNIYFRIPEEKDTGLIQHLLSECNLPYQDIDLAIHYFLLPKMKGK